MGRRDALGLKLTMPPASPWRFPHGSTVLPAGAPRRPTASAAAPHVLINCLQNSACSLFALFLCELLNATHSPLCIPDSTCEDDGRSLTGLFKTWPNESEPMVLKTTISAEGAARRFEQQIEQHTAFTHRILWLREPVQNYMSLIQKPWCGNCGGL